MKLLKRDLTFFFLHFCYFFSSDKIIYHLIKKRKKQLWLIFIAFFLRVISILALRYHTSFSYARKIKKCIYPLMRVTTVTAVAIFPKYAKFRSLLTSLLAALLSSVCAIRA